MSPADPAALVRRPAIGRTAIGREPFVPIGRWRMPKWLRRVLIALLIQALILAAYAAVDEVRKPRSLATSELTGTRRVNGRICIDEAVDISGSMQPYAAEGNRADQELYAFSRRELDPSDLISKTYFAGSAGLALRPTPMADLSSAPGVPSGIDGQGTNLAPAIETLMAARTANTVCAARALIIITDGEIFDASKAAAALPKTGYTRVFAVVPAVTGWRRPGPLRGALDAIYVYHFNGPGLFGRLASMIADAKPLDVIFGEIAASLTGQQLKQTQHRGSPGAHP